MSSYPVKVYLLNSWELDETLREEKLILVEYINHCSMEKLDNNGDQGSGAEICFH